MRFRFRHLAALAAPVILAWSATAYAANCSNGRALYLKQIGATYVGCAQSTCHGTNPATNKNNIQLGGGSPANIDNAIATVPDMAGIGDPGGVYGPAGLTASDVADIADWIFFAPTCPSGSPSVSASPNPVAFGSVNVGSSSPRTVTISNTGGAAATGMTYGAAPAGYTRTHNCPASLAAGASCTMTVTFSPTAAQAYNGNITITGSGGINVSLGLSGTGTSAAAPNVSASPGSLSFGSVTVGSSSASQNVTVSNTGSAAASGMTYGAAPTGFSRTTTCTATIAAGASCTITVTFSPTAAQAYGGNISITGTGGISVSIALSGAGVIGAPPPAGQLSMVSSVTMPATTVGSTSAPQAVTVSNIGGQPVTVASITSSNNGEFAVGGSTCANVAAGGGCSFNITFIPAATGARTATVTIVSSGTGSPQSITVTGTGNPAGGGGGGAATAVAIEYYHAAFDHYFVTAIADEITKLDNGTFVGWARTGKQFKVYIVPGSGLFGVCRFFSTSFNPKSSHFYTADPNECTVVKANKDWTFEDVVFYVPVPSVMGSCPIGTMPVFRLYNNGQGAAPNHRFTIESTVRDQMLSLPQPWIPEGFGVGVTMCSPP